MLLIVVNVLLLQMRRGGVHSTELIVVVAVLEILHLQEIIIAAGLLVAMLLMHGLSHSLILMLLSIHLQHVVALRFGAPSRGRLQRWQPVNWSPHIIGSSRTMRVMGREGCMLVL